MTLNHLIKLLTAVRDRDKRAGRLHVAVSVFTEPTWVLSAVNSVENISGEEIVIWLTDDQESLLQKATGGAAFANAARAAVTAAIADRKE